MRKIFSLLLVLILSAAAAFAHVTDLPVKTINGKNYYYYTVKQGDTLYSLSKSFGVSIDDIIEYNPVVGDGLKAMTTLYFPQTAFKKPAAKQSSADSYLSKGASGGYESYKVSKGETVYGISKQHGITIEQLIEANPQLADGLKAGMTIRIPASGQPSEKPAKSESQKPNVATTPPAAKADEQKHPAPVEKSDTYKRETTAVTTSSVQYYTIRQGESLYGIAKSMGTTVDALLDLNPDLSASNYKAGTMIRVPATSYVAADNSKETDSTDKKETMTKPDSTEVAVNVDKPSATGNEESKHDSVKVEEDASSDINIAVMLPFALDGSRQSKSAQRATEFYKGFLIATDSLRNSSTPIHITTFDVADDAGLSKALASPELSATDVIIGPESDEMLERIASYADKHNITLINMFNVKSSLHEAHKSVIQANIPSTMMTRVAIEGFLDKYAGYTPVFLSPKAGKREKSDFVSALKKALVAKKIKYEEITYSSNFKKTDFEAFNPKIKYVFVPLSATGAEFDHFVIALKDLRRASNSTANVALFGYPEWITFRGSRLEQLQGLNTTIYSRLFNDDASIENKEISDAFQRWFGTKMENALPVQGILGFDAGYYLISTMKRAKGSFRPESAPRGIGIQSCFEIESAGEGKGWVNKGLFFIEFRPSGVMSRKAL